MVATDIRTGEEVVIKTGKVADAARASLSIPGIFVPVELGERLLVDGALVNRVPAGVCRELGADVVIAVDVGFPPVGGRTKNLADIIMRTIEILDRQSAKFRPVEADIIIRPELRNITYAAQPRCRNHRCRPFCRGSAPRRNQSSCLRGGPSGQVSEVLVVDTPRQSLYNL